MAIAVTTASNPSTHDRMIAGGESGRFVDRAISTKRNPTSAMPRQAIHSGTQAIIGACVPSISAPEPADLADGQRVVARRHRRTALLLEKEVGSSHRGAVGACASACP
jgi:hypothetical protein